MTAIQAIAAFAVAAYFLCGLFAMWKAYNDPD